MARYHIVSMSFFTVQQVQLTVDFTIEPRPSGAVIPGAFTHSFFHGAVLPSPLPHASLHPGNLPPRHPSRANVIVSPQNVLADISSGEAPRDRRVSLRPHAKRPRSGLY